MPPKLKVNESITATTVPDPIRVGWLQKQGGAFRNWKKRYFVLSQSGKLYYFKAEGANSGQAMGVIPIEDCEVRVIPDGPGDAGGGTGSGGDGGGGDGGGGGGDGGGGGSGSVDGGGPGGRTNCFEIRHPIRKAYILHAEEEVDARTWVAVLRCAVEEVRRASDPDYKSLGAEAAAARGGANNDWKRITFAPGRGGAVQLGSGGDPGMGDAGTTGGGSTIGRGGGSSALGARGASNLAGADGAAVSRGSGGGSSASAGVGGAGGGAGGGRQTSGSGVPSDPTAALFTRKKPSALIPARRDLDLAMMFKDWLMRNERPRGSEDRSLPVRGEKISSYYLVEKIVPTPRKWTRHARFLLFTTRAMYVVEPVEPYKLKRGIPYGDLKRVTIDMHNATLVRFCSTSGYTAYFLTICKEVLESMVGAISKGVKLLEGVAADEEPKLTIENIFSESQNPIDPNPSEAGSLQEMSIHDYAVRDSIAPVLKALTEAGHSAQDIWDGMVDLVHIVNLFSSTLRPDSVDPTAAFVVDFVYPREFPGPVRSKPYNIGVGRTVERVLRLVCKKAGVRRWQRFALATMGGQELQPHLQFSAYGLGTLLKSWRLRVVVSGSAEARSRREAEDIALEILHKIIVPFSLDLWEAREIQRAEAAAAALAEERRRKREEEERLRREHKIKMECVAEVIDSIIDEVYYGSMANSRQRSIDLCMSIVMEEIVERAWVPVRRRQLVVERVRELGENSQLLILQFLGSLGAISGRQLKSIVDAVGSGDVSAAVGSLGLSSSRQQYTSAGGPSGSTNASGHAANSVSSNSGSGSTRKLAPGERPAPPPMPMPMSAPGGSGDSPAAVITAAEMKAQLQEKARARGQRRIAEDPEEVRRRERDQHKHTGIAQDLFMGLQRKFDFSGGDFSDVEDLSEDSDSFESD